MSKKIVSGILLLIFSTSTINLPASWSEKVATIRQKVKNSIKKVTLKDALDYTFKAAVVVALIVEWRHQKEQFKFLHETFNKSADAFNKNATVMKAHEEEIKNMRGNQIGLKKIQEFLAEAHKCLAYPHTEIEEKDGQIKTQTVIPIYQHLDLIRQQINQIMVNLEKLQPEKKNQENAQKPAENKKKRKKEKRQNKE